jgi:hypothetical protein
VLTEKPGEGGGVWDLPQIILKSRWSDGASIVRDAISG